MNQAFLDYYSLEPFTQWIHRTLCGVMPEDWAVFIEGLALGIVILLAYAVLAVVLIRVPGAWLLSNAYSDTLFPMGIASPCGSILSAGICVIAFTVLNRRGAFDKLVA